jgi:hypothetical protein
MPINLAFGVENMLIHGQSPLAKHGKTAANAVELPTPRALIRTPMERNKTVSISEIHYGEGRRSEKSIPATARTPDGSLDNAGMKNYNTPDE